MQDTMQKTLQRNLLKYSAGRAITCPKCGQIADYRHWVIWESPLGQHGAHCDACWREGLALIHDDKPHAYLISIGWQVDTLVDFDKPPKKAPTPYPQKCGTALNSFLRRDISMQAKVNGNMAKSDRKFPDGYISPTFRESEVDGTISIEYDGNAVYSGYQIQEYARKFCELNHLTM